MTTVATLDPPQLTVAPGGEASCVLTVHNRTDIVEGYHIEVLGDAAGWATIEPAGLRIYPGSEASARVTFRMPPGARQLQREVPFAVRVRPMERPADVVVPEGLLHIGELTAIGGELLPETSKARRTAVHDVAIDNNGNTPLQVAVDASDPEDALAMRVRPPGMVVPPGQTTIAQVRVRNRRLLWRGKPAPHRFRVAVTSPATQPVVLDGTTVQEPVIGSWLWKAALALLALVLLAAGLWMGLVKPAVKSAADKAADEAVASQAAAQAAAAKASKEAGGAGAGAGASASASAPGAGAGSPSPSAPAGIPFSQTVSFSIGRGTSKGQNVTRPPKTRLQVSYIQLQAPQGDDALLTLTIDRQQTIFPYQLYNIRIYDVHPIPPIEVPVDKQLHLDLKCNGPGNDPAGKAASVCKVDIQFTGTVYPTG